MNNTALRAQDILQGEISEGEIQGQLSFTSLEYLMTRDGISMKSTT